jgi:hypothetical protein
MARDPEGSLAIWYQRRGSNPHVPCGTRDFESRASASSATLASFLVIVNSLLRFVNNLRETPPLPALVIGVRRDLYYITNGCIYVQCNALRRVVGR